MKKTWLSLMLIAVFCLSNPVYAEVMDEENKPVAIFSTEAKEVERGEEQKSAEDVAKDLKETPKTEVESNVLDNQQNVNLLEDKTASKQKDVTASSEDESSEKEEGVREDARETLKKSPREKESIALKKGTTLDKEVLRRVPLNLGEEDRHGGASEDEVFRVNSFEELKAAIEGAKAGEHRTIVIDSSFELRETLTIKAGQNITLTANNRRPEAEKHAWEKPWEKVTQPADLADQGEKEQRDAIEEARRRGESAMSEADTPLPDENKGAVIIKRAKEFISDTLFKVIGKLTLGTKDSAIYIDDNKDVQTALASAGVVADVEGDLVMDNGTIYHVDNKQGYSAPIRVRNGGRFTMNGGRMTHNTAYEQIRPLSERPTSSGGVYVDPGGKFLMNNGLIDHNKGCTGGVFAGDLYGSDKDFAYVEINGGLIVKNRAATRYGLGGALSGFPKSHIVLKDGILAGNESDENGGAISISDQGMRFSNTINGESSSVAADYDRYLIKNKASLDVLGGLIYKNDASYAGGGLYIDTNYADFSKGMILDNYARQWGGGIYVSFPPRVQRLKDLLITENNAFGGTYEMYFGGGNGGGIWNCPTGYVHIGDGHSIYVYDNESAGYGKDFTFSRKTGNFKLNQKEIAGVFYSHVSPVTKLKNIIKFLEDSTKGVDIPKRMSYTDDVVHLRAMYDALLKEEAWGNAKTFILGNRARNGGGIGSNANLQTEGDEGEYGLKIKKKWDESIDETTLPYGKTIKADIFIVPLDKDRDYVKLHYGIDPKLYKYGEVELNRKNHWEALFHTQGKKFSPDSIHDFPKINHWDFAFKKDRGLPFTAEELRAKGLKYLVVEQGDEYFSTVEEFPKTAEKQAPGVSVEIARTDHPNYLPWTSKDPDVYLYYFDKKANNGHGALVLLERKEINAENGYKEIFKHPQLVGVKDVKYYGTDRKFLEFGEDWSDVAGYHIGDRGYTFVISENEDGTKTLLVPYLWTAGYGNYGFSVDILKEAETTIPGSPHTFEITNYRRVDLPVEKAWKLNDEALKDIPDSVKLYLLLDNKRILIGYERDKDGNYVRDKEGKPIPIYQSIVLRKEDGWKGHFENLNPLALLKNRYSVEEEENGYLPFVTMKDDGKISFAIDFKTRYSSIFNPSNTETHIDGPFKPYLGNISFKLHLRIPGQEDQVLIQQFTWTSYEDEGEKYWLLNRDHAIFQDIPVDLKGMDLRVKYYDVISNELGLTSYDLYLEQDKQGFYTLYIPTVVIEGVPYKQFYMKDFKRDSGEEPKVEIENYPGPTHEIEIEKNWHEDKETARPGTLKIKITDKDGHVKEIVLKKGEDYKTVLKGLKGRLSSKEYTLVEEAIKHYRSEKKQSLSLKLRRKVDDKKELLPIYIYLEGKKLDDAVIYSTIDRGEIQIDSKTLAEILSKGKYQYKLYKPEENALSADVSITKNSDGSYTIALPVGVEIAEVLDVVFNNYYEPETPPEKPEEPPETPEEPPETPEEPPETPEEPPETPEEPPETPEEPPETPEEPPVVPPKQPPKTPPTGSPKTFDPGIGTYLMASVFSSIGLLGIGFSRRKQNS